MALTYIGTGGIFTVLGKYMHALKTLNVTRQTTVYTEVQDAINAYKATANADLDFDIAVGGTDRAEQAWRASGSSLAAALASSCEGFLIQSIRLDSLNNRLSLVECLEYLIDAMKADDYYVDPSAVSVAVAPSLSNSGTDFQIGATDVGKLGTQLDNTLAEAIEVEAISSNTLRFTGERSAATKLSESWPDGSGVLSDLQPLGISDSIISNGDFSAETIPNVPDGWIIPNGTPGTSYRLTSYARQTIAISGTPTGGFYNIGYVNPVSGNSHSTSAISYDAESSEVQAALRAIPGLEQVTVESSGASPDLTHTIEFIGVAGTVAQMTSTNKTTGGSIAHVVVENGEVGAINGQGMKFIDNSNTTILQQLITVEPDVVYSFGMWVYFSTSGNTMNGEVSLRSGSSGAVLTDSSGFPQQRVVSINAGSAGLNHVSSFFRVSPSSPSELYLYIDITGAVVADAVIDNVIMAPAIQLYPGGPYVELFEGRTPPVIGDKWTLTAANDYAGDFQQRFNQVFPMAENGLMLPTSGASQIADSLIG